ncbi:MAG: fibronectin type III domain-containing protein [Prevotella sp.]|nr:fibronectin type III domain-containing protein [Prevotella sp.]
MKRTSYPRFLARAAVTLLAVLFSFTGARADEVTIGDLGTAGNDSYLPMNSLYNYSYTQQIYTPDEIGMAGTINSITLYLYGNANLYEMPFDIYMVETDKEAFSSTSDWVTVTASDIVYSGSVTVHNTTAEAYTFELTTPFNYSGTGNLVICFDNNTGQWKSGLNGMVFTAEDAVVRSIYARQDSNGYDPTNMDGISGTATTAKRNVILLDITPAGGVTVEKPATFEVSNVTAYGATLAWTGGTGTYNLELKEGDNENWDELLYHSADTSIDLDELAPNTSYVARVQSVDGEGNVSGWRTVSFKTKEVCPDGKVCIGEGTATNNYLPTYTFYNHSLTQQIYTAAELGEGGFILSVDFFCSGAVTRNLDIYMVSTNKSSFESTTDWESVTSSDLVFSGEVTFAAGDWTTIEFENPFEYNGDSNVVLVVDDNTGSYVTSPSFYVFDAASQALRVYSDGTDYDPSTPSSYEGTVLSVKNRVRFAIGEPPAVQKPVGLTATEVGKRSVVLSWTQKDEATSWQVCLNDDETNLIPANSNPFTVTGLEPETEYTAKVRATIGEDVSDWSNTVTFTTDIAFPAPTEVAAGEITATSAEISWSGDADSYNLRYRVAPLGGELVTDFEDSSMGDWTTIDADGDGYDWVLGSECGGVYLIAGSSLAGSGHDDSADLVVSGSYSNLSGVGALTPDNYLVSPLVALGGSISFWACGQDGSFPAEHFGVAVSTTSNTDPSAFTTIQEWTMTAKSSGAKAKAGTTRSGNRGQGTWYQYTVDLSAYAGQQGYVAIRHFDCTDMFMLDIDDITIEQPSGTEEPWTVVEDVESPYTIEGLTPETKYQVQVQAVYTGEDEGESVWTTATFTTLEEVPTPTAVAAANVTSRTAELSWTENGEATAWQICLNGDEDNLIAANENPFVLTGLTPETAYSAKVRAIFGEKQSSWSKPATFTTDIACPAPTDLTVSDITSSTAEVAWEADPAATGFELQYTERPDVTDATEVLYDNGTFATSIGSDGGGTWTWGVLYTSDNFADFSGNENAAINAVSIYETSSNTGDITINIYQGGETPDEGELIHTQTVTPEAAEGFHKVLLDTPVSIDPDDDLWITLTETGTYVMASCETTEENNQWVYDGGEWANIGDLASSLAGYGWMIRAEVGTADGSEVEWQTVADATSPTELTGLNPETTYLVKVKAIYDGGDSEWTSTMFTTLVGNPVPYDIEADLVADGATLTWTGEGDSYNVRYRTAENTEITLYQDFEGGLGAWQTINSNTSNILGVSSEDGIDESSCFVFSSYTNATSYDQYLISPSLSSVGTLSFFYKNTNTSGEVFKVGYSSTDTEIDNFTWGDEVTADTKTWQEYTETIPEGTKYIAIHYYSDYKYYLLVDDISVSGNTTPASDWTTITNIEDATVDLSGLDTNNGYEYQIQSVKGGETSEWSEVNEFALLTLDNNATDNSSLIVNNIGRQAHVTLANRKLFKDDTWNTLCLPFDIDDLDESPLAGATVKSLSDATVEGTHITMTFDEYPIYGGIPYIIKWAPGTDIENPKFANVIINATSTYNLEYGDENGSVKFIGYYDAFNITPDDDDIYYMGSDSSLKHTAVNRTLKSLRAYFQFTGAATLARDFTLNFGDEEATGIVEVDRQATTNDSWYGVNGVKFDQQPVRKGLYIRNGQKVVIK